MADEIDDDDSAYIVDDEEAALLTLAEAENALCDGDVERARQALADFPIDPNVSGCATPPLGLIEDMLGQGRVADARLCLERILAPKFETVEAARNHYDACRANPQTGHHVNFLGRLA